MAYFANSSEGEYYEEQYCNRCVHFALDEICPVLVLHELWNYEACRGGAITATQEEKLKHTALDTLWPRENVGNGKCRMFYDAANKEGGWRW